MSGPGRPLCRAPVRRAARHARYPTQPNPHHPFSMHAPDNPETEIRHGEDLVVFSRAELDGILSDCFVDMREVVRDDQAADCVDIVRDRLTDDFYTNSTAPE